MMKSIEIMINRIIDILFDNKPSIYIYGSVVFDDFKPGWSDIDIICFTEKGITNKQADQLVNLRQKLLEEYKDNEYFRCFEGGFVSWDSFINEKSDIVVYWGTSGQRITDKHYVDTFSMIELLNYGYLLYGNDIRRKLKYPTNDEIKNAVVNYYDIIRKYAVETDRSLHSVGWLLDIARCIYTLRTGNVIAKTIAGEWALNNKLVPDVEVMEKVISIRKNPCKYKNDDEIMKWTEIFDYYIQRFADVLKEEINYLEL